MRTRDQMKDLSHHNMPIANFEKKVSIDKKYNDSIQLIIFF